jgi:hypothetical protein
MLKASKKGTARDPNKEAEVDDNDPFESQMKLLRKTSFTLHENVKKFPQC